MSPVQCKLTNTNRHATKIQRMRMLFAIYSYIVCIIKIISIKIVMVKMSTGFCVVCCIYVNFSHSLIRAQFNFSRRHMSFATTLIKAFCLKIQYFRSYSTSNFMLSFAVHINFICNLNHLINFFFFFTECISFLHLFTNRNSNR